MWGRVELLSTCRGFEVAVDLDAETYAEVGGLDFAGAVLHLIGSQGIVSRRRGRRRGCPRRRGVQLRRGVRVHFLYLVSTSRAGLKFHRSLSQSPGRLRQFFWLKPSRNGAD